MRWTKVIGAGLLAACLTGTVYAADATGAAGAGPVGPLRQRWMQNRAAQQNQTVTAGNPAIAGLQRLGFILWYLNQFPDVKQVVQDHKAKMEAFQAQLKGLRELVRTKMQNAPTLEERQAIIDTAKTDAGNILGQIVDEAVAHHRQMADLAVKHKDEIVKRAVERIFQRPRRFGGKPAGQPNPPPAQTPAQGAGAPMDPAEAFCGGAPDPAKAGFDTRVSEDSFGFRRPALFRGRDDTPREITLTQSLTLHTALSIISHQYV